MNIQQYTYYYFLGIGGISMSSLARYMHFLDKTVLGYDKTRTKLTQKIEDEGIAVHYEDLPNGIPSECTPENTLVIHTPAVPTELKEYQYFASNDFTILKRSAFLAQLTLENHSIAVAGTHGKTTTSTLIAHILEEAGLPVTGFLGGIARKQQSNLILGGSEISVVEADEYDRSFLQLHPNIGVITSMDADHLDVYDRKEALESSFLSFSEQISDAKIARYGLPVPNAITYGFEEDADVRATNIRVENHHFMFDVEGKCHLKEVCITLPGRHNIENTLAAIIVAFLMEVSAEKIKKSLNNFQGIHRRFNLYRFDSKAIIDDYAHHPKEISATLKAVRSLYPEAKILAAFQPHLFSRTRDFADEFAHELAQLDELVLLDVYPAREKPIDGITSDWLLHKIDLKHKEVCRLEASIELLKQKKFDVLLIIGAGDIDTIVQPLVEHFKAIEA